MSARLVEIEDTAQAGDSDARPAESTSAATVRLRRRHRARALPGIDAYSIEEFCRRHGISVALFFKLQKEGKGPVTMAVGGRKLISAEAAAAWRRQCEGGAE